MECYWDVKKNDFAILDYCMWTYVKNKSNLKWIYSEIFLIVSVCEIFFYTIQQLQISNLTYFIFLSLTQKLKNKDLQIHQMCAEMFGIHLIHNARDAITRFGNERVEHEEIRWRKNKSFNRSSSILGKKNMTAAGVLWVRELESLSGYKDLPLVFTEQDWWVSVIGDNESQQEMVSELQWHFAKDMHEIGDLL